MGNGFVVEPVNSAYNIYRTNGTKIAGPFNVNRLFNDGFTQFTSDPRCYYDKSTNTWFATIPFDTAERAGAAWFKITPRLNGQQIGGASIRNQGYVVLRGNYLIYPAVQASSDGTASMIMTLSGQKNFPSVVFTILQKGRRRLAPSTWLLLEQVPTIDGKQNWGTRVIEVSAKS